MKRLTAILISLLTVVTALCGVCAAGNNDETPVDAYLDNGRLVIERQSDMSDTAVAAYYSGRTLCGSYLVKTDGNVYAFDIPVGYTKIRVWFTDEDETRPVQIIDRSAAVSPTPTPSLPVETPSPSIAPTEEPADDDEYYDEGYGGFLEPSDNTNEDVQTFTFSVECHNAFLSDKLNDELRAALPVDGFIAPAAEYTLTEGMTVYDALMEAADKYGFDINSKSGYVSAIGNLGEFDCGPFSGWMYLVNGEAILSPMNSYVIKDGDTVQIAYTISLGGDLGSEVE